MLVRAFLGIALSAAACAGPPSKALSVAPAATEPARAPIASPSTSAAARASVADDRGAEPIVDAAAAAPDGPAAAPDGRPPDGPAAAPEPPPAPPAESPALSTLKSYYADLNGRRFEAARYFAPSVKQYITMQRPSNSALNHYIRDVFPKQFESYEFLFEEGSLHQESPNVYTYLERCRYYVVKAREFRMTVAEVRVELDADGRIVDLRHAKVLSRESTPEQR